MTSYGAARRWRLAALAVPVCAVALSGALMAQTAPPFKSLRYDENYEYLRNVERRTSRLDALKFIPLRADGSSYLSLGGEVRERFELIHHVAWGSGPRDDDGYLLQRYMLHADLHFGESLRIFTQLKSGLEEGREGGPRPTDRDSIDLHQAFIDWSPSGFSTSPLTLRVGRQELAYGSSRLISNRDGPNVRLSFDGVKVVLRSRGWQVHAFTMRPVRTHAGAWDDDGDQNELLWGVYASAPSEWMRGVNTEFYYLGVHRDQARFDQGSAEERRHSLGARISRRNAGWDYNLEAVYQFGTFGPGNIRAWTLASDWGFQFNERKLKPRLGLKADVTSGDKNRDVPDLQTFNPLFPRGAYFGEPALVGPANHIDIHPSVSLDFGAGFALDLGWDRFWRESAADGIYGPSVNVLRSGVASSARNVGDQIEAKLDWSINRNLGIGADYAHFFASRFLAQTGTGKDIDYMSVWATLRF